MSGTDLDVGVQETVSRFLKRRFEVDPRGLAGLRVALGALLVADLLARSRDLVAFYTDAGVLPRPLLCQEHPVICRASLHAVVGTSWFQVLLFAAAVAAAVALAVGIRTRVAAVVSFVLLISLHARNPMVLNGGDAILRRLLFWGTLLPLGARWSVDAARTGGRDEPVVGVASAGLLLQVVAVYTVNGILKLQNPSWFQGVAIRKVFQLDQFTVLLGPLLTGQPVILGVVSKAWLVMLTGSILLVVSTGRSRVVAVSLFAAAHAGMLLTMRLGLFPLVSMAALLPFLPSRVWDGLEGRVPPLRRRYEESRGGPLVAPFTRGFLPPRVGGSPEGSRRWRGVAAGVAVLALGAAGVWNAAAVGAVDAPDLGPTSVDPRTHRWDMFVHPLTTDVWYTAPGSLESGMEVHAFHGGPIPTDGPPDAEEMYPTPRWRKYLVDVWREGNPDLVWRFAGYLCKRWDDQHPTEMDMVKVRRHLEETSLGEAGSVDHETLAVRACP